ncbi:MAG TPA: biotin-dependent carboxyltransferase family protein [Bacillota bacterium]|nr:biotin-dependent carboxyltransferase family protein [Bacillota bacterium]HOH10454.1 biotin-dependent carboxyltransferase family protein [Bacillota bacterium]HOY89147.1 biotin-dependent carboxyltransferase family protein [Bacillota bacterium]HPI01070.1 biotin-dependent carboxyltransferase family protein [Bacillota bacterium]HPM63167.1 biotin-dependent carboxyltransferase family protein [Bacillota bacterium]
MSGSVRILKPGLLATVQDLGRKGAMAWGVPGSGAADQVSMRIANLLVGNEQEDATIEFTMGGFEVEFLDDVLFAISGVSGDASLDKVPIATTRAVYASAGSALAMGPLRSGARQYLALSGGIDVPVVLGSRSTYLKGGLGGYEGRALKRGDVLRTFPGRPENKLGSLKEGFHLPSLEKDARGISVLRVTEGTMSGRFQSDAIDRMLSAVYEVLPESDRMGIRLAGEKVLHKEGADILSGGIEPGAVQVPGSGNPIILMVDRQTTGGYTKAFSVISADRSKLGQLRPGDKVRFSMVGLEEAHGAFLGLEESIKDSVRFDDAGPRRFSVKVDGRTYAVEVEEVL